MPRTESSPDCVRLLSTVGGGRVPTVLFSAVRASTAAGGGEGDFSAGTAVTGAEATGAAGPTAEPGFTESTWSTLWPHAATSASSAIVDRFLIPVSEMSRGRSGGSVHCALAACQLVATL